MGGITSGCSVERTLKIEDCVSITTSKIKSPCIAVLLTPGQHGVITWPLFDNFKLGFQTFPDPANEDLAGYIEFTFLATGRQQGIYAVFNPCFRCARYYFRCPKCEKNFCFLSLLHNFFACRKCHHLLHRSTMDKFSEKRQRDMQKSIQHFIKPRTNIMERDNANGRSTKIPI